jgi:hypothetical protein
MTQSAHLHRRDVAAWVLPIADRVAPHVLTVLAFCAPFPAVADASAGPLAELPVIGAVPPYVPAAIIGLLAAVAVRMAPARCWPLFVVAATVVVAVPTAGDASVSLGAVPRVVGHLGGEGTSR